MSTALETGNQTSRRVWILAAFALGLILGLVLAWQVWPARWVDTDPSDLRAEHQRTYVIMVADSYSVTGDANVARERLYQLVDDDTDWAAVDALVVATAAELEAEGNPAAALRLRRMLDSVPLPVERAAPPVATVEPERAAPAIPRWALVFIGLGVVVMVVALVIWLVTNEMRKREATYESGSEQMLAEPYRARTGRAVALEPVPGPGGLGIHATERTERDTPPWDDAAFMAEEREQERVSLELEAEEEELLDLTELDEEEELEEWEEEEEEHPLAQRPDLATEEGWHVEAAPAEPTEAATETVARLVELPALEEDEAPAEPEALRLAPAEETSALATFDAIYNFGDDDFYHAFTIESPQHEFLGQCGIVISDVLGIEGAQLVDAFDLWLFETRGTRTVSTVLASEFAYTDEDLSAKLARKGELVLAEEGLVVTLQAESLRLVATVRELGYREDQVEPDSVFDHLHVHMVIEQIA